ncbi:hypothetical protein O9H85_11460 [Paenibacillus filicis]|uniref:Uncharacterized protein n=1 Tax=Paenibacillus gyeongsangnamensis TaxID=3388067 RepID=A0ABT4Q876_9BACL|nr:hypothetical protein [Paenibacillus filicis]MCZ8513028.1 hypothetical protein [Paenibacillus filicis]
MDQSMEHLNPLFLGMFFVIICGVIAIIWVGGKRIGRSEEDD